MTDSIPFMSSTLVSREIPIPRVAAEDGGIRPSLPPQQGRPARSRIPDLPSLRRAAQKALHRDPVLADAVLQFIGVYARVQDVADQALAHGNYRGAAILYQALSFETD